jgi:hypothetical protein
MAQGMLGKSTTYRKATKEQESIIQPLDYRLSNAWYGYHGPGSLSSLR